MSGSALLGRGDLRGGGGLISQEAQSKGCWLGFRRQDLWGCLARVGLALWFSPVGPPHLGMVWSTSPLGPTAQTGPPAPFRNGVAQLPEAPGPGISVPLPLQPHCGQAWCSPVPASCGPPRWLRARSRSASAEPAPSWLGCPQLAGPVHRTLGSSGSKGSER